MLHNIINEQGHWLGVRDDISRGNEYFSHGFLYISGFWCLNLMK